MLMAGSTAMRTPASSGIKRVDCRELSSHTLATSLLFPSLLMDLHGRPRDYDIFSGYKHLTHFGTKKYTY